MLVHLPSCQETKYKTARFNFPKTSIYFDLGYVNIYSCLDPLCISVFKARLPAGPIFKGPF